MGGRYNAHIHVHGAVAAHGLKLTLLEHPQDLHLQIRTHIPDLIQENRPAVRLLELAHLVGRGPGERPAHMTEELALQ